MKTKTKPKNVPVLAAPRKQGRPVEPVDPVKADAFIAWISSGKTLREFSRQPGNPSWQAIYDWTAKSEVFAAQYAQARDLGYDQIAEETLTLIDQIPDRIQSDGSSRYDPAYVAWAKNRVEQRMKLLAVWSPKKYGNRLEIEGGGVGLAIQINLNQDGEK